MFSDLTRLARLIWAALVIVAFGALITGRWPLVFVSVATLALSVAPGLLARWVQVFVPPGFIVAITLFVSGTLFFGEVFDFYERFWWWDMAMHGGSAIGFGLIGFVLTFMLFQGDRYAAPHWAMALLAFCFAMTVGALWEIFEFTMDMLFGFNMLKSGVMDTFWDLVLNTIGALIGAMAGYAYLKGRAYGGLTGIIEEFVRRNPRFFKRRK